MRTPSSTSSWEAAAETASTAIEYNRRMGKALQQHEDYYPQLFDTIYVSNAPIWIQTPWSMVRSVLPKRMVAKIDFVKPTGRSSKGHRKVLYKHVSQQALPALMGGDNSTPISKLTCTC